MKTEEEATQLNDACQKKVPEMAAAGVVFPILMATLVAKNNV
jgi:hypothetical protein